MNSNKLILCILLTICTISCSKKNESSTQNKYDLFIAGYASKDEKYSYFYYKNDELTVGNLDQHSFIPLDYAIDDSYVHNNNLYTLLYTLTGSVSKYLIYKNGEKIVEYDFPKNKGFDLTRIKIVDRP